MNGSSYLTFHHNSGPATGLRPWQAVASATYMKNVLYSDMKKVRSENPWNMIEKTSPAQKR